MTPRPFRLAATALAAMLALAPDLAAQTATQILLTQPGTGDGTPFSVDSTGRQVGVHDLSRSTTFNGNTAEATNQTTWDLNPEAGRFSVSSTSDYSGWQGSGVTLDTRYFFGVFDTFTINAGDSGFSNGDNVQLNLSLSFDVTARTDGEKFQTASNWLNFTVQQRDPVVGAFGSYDSDELFRLEYEVTVYEFIEKAVINGVTQFDNTVTYVNGQGNEADLYSFDITLNAVVGETLELGMMLGDFNPVDYDYSLANLVSGTRQDIGNSQTDYGNHFAATFSWDIEHVEGFDGLDVAAASGFVTSASVLSAVPEPSTYAALLGAGALGLAVHRRRRHAVRASPLCS